MGATTEAALTAAFGKIIKLWIARRAEQRRQFRDVGRHAPRLIRSSALCGLFDCSNRQWPYRAMSDRLKLAREIAARTKPRFIEIPRERRGGKVTFTEEQLTAMRGGLSAEEYRWKLIREWGDQD